MPGIRIVRLIDSVLNHPKKHSCLSIEAIFLSGVSHGHHGETKLAKIVIAFGLRTLVHLSATFVERQR